MNLISTTSHINENPSSYSIFIISMKSNEIQSPYSKPAGQNPITPPESLSPFVINDQKEDKNGGFNHPEEGETEEEDRKEDMAEMVEEEQVTDNRSENGKRS
jgi:hypothetical protein